jgi:hypothetical protein
LLLKAMTVDERIELLAADDPAWKIAPGCYRVMVGDSSRTIALNGLLRPWRSRLPPLISAIVTHPVIFHLIRRRVLSHTHPPTRYK